MLSFLLPFASKIITDAVNKIPEDAELGEKLIDICLVIIGKAVKLTKTDMDDKLLEQVDFISEHYEYIYLNSNNY